MNLPQKLSIGNKEIFIGHHEQEIQCNEYEFKVFSFKKRNY